MIEERISYAQAVGELEAIINEIESESIDVDVLTEKVKRATRLIQFCKSKLRDTESEVKKLLSELEESRKDISDTDDIDDSETEIEPF